jgi:hypothetical protein
MTDGCRPSLDRTGSDRLELRHGERAFLRVTVRVPEQASAGDHHGALIVTRDVQSQPMPGFNIISRVAALFIITVEGDVVQEAAVDRIESLRPIYWFLPASLRLFASATKGRCTCFPVHIAIRNMFGIPVDAIPVQNWVILRESTRARTVEWKPRFALGRYTCDHVLLRLDGRPLAPVSVILGDSHGAAAADPAADFPRVAARANLLLALRAHVARVSEVTSGKNLIG